MKLVVTIYEETAEAAVGAIRALPAGHDLVEVRAEKFPSADLQAIRAATEKPIILTYRGAANPDARAALAAGIDYVDVEWQEGVPIDVPHRTVLSHHDYDGMGDAEGIMQKMRLRDCAYTKLAVTPQNFADNLRLLAVLPGTVIGMGERGLYSRILAPFKGSELTFVAANKVAAPGQLTLERALEIYGTHSARTTQPWILPPPSSISPRPPSPTKVFAVVGNPAGHSLSPSVHNRLFREKGIPAAYTIASIENFSEIAEAFLRGEPCGLSVTTPFKDDAYAFAVERNFEIGENARRARAVNTLVNANGRLLADNTDVDGFAAILPRIESAAVLGAGGTGRAARVALANAGVPAITFNRTASKGDAPLPALAIYDGDCIINTLPAGTNVSIPPTRVYVEAAYGGAPADVNAQIRIGGLELLQAQAQRQHELFMKVFDGI